MLVSSSEVYGTAELAPMDEEHPLNPRSPYAATKAGADRLAYSYFVTYGLPIVIVRPFNNYGPRQHPEKVVPRFITQALGDEPLTIHGDGHASRDWLYVDDDAEAIGAVIDAPIDDIAGEVLNIATGVDISVADDRGPRARRARQAGRPAALRRRAAGPGRPAHRLDRQGRAAARLARRRRRSRKASSRRSRGIARMKPGGERFSLAKPAPSRPRRRPGSARAARGRARPRALARSRRP